MDDLQAKLAEAREQRAHLEKLLAERSAVADASRALLAKDNTYPRKRREVEFELHTAEMDCQWIQADLAPLVSRERLLEAALGDEMAHDLELAAAETARAAQAAKGKAAIRPPRKTEALSDN